MARLPLLSNRTELRLSLTAAMKLSLRAFGLIAICGGSALPLSAQCPSGSLSSSWYYWYVCPYSAGNSEVSIFTLATLLLLWAGVRVWISRRRLEGKTATGGAFSVAPGRAKRRVSQEFLFRAGLTVFLSTLAHLVSWQWLRYLTSEAVLRISPWMHLSAARYTSDTIQVGGQFFQFVVACTFVDLFLGSVPLIWVRRKTLPINLLRIAAAAAILFVFNLARLGAVQFVFARGGMPFTWVDGVAGGCAYLLVWLAIWSQRTWDFWETSAAAGAQSKSDTRLTVRLQPWDAAAVRQV